jgi:hypothetical protein
MEAATKIRYKGGWYNDRKHGRGIIFVIKEHSHTKMGTN